MQESKYTAGDILLEDLGDYTACFCRDTGATVVLDALTAAIAQQIIDAGEITRASLVGRIADLAKDSSLPLESALSASLAHLDAERLVRIVA